MTITINDGVSLLGALRAGDALAEAANMLQEVQRLINRAEHECDVEVDCSAALEDVECAINEARDEVKTSLHAYTQGTE